MTAPSKTTSMPRTPADLPAALTADTPAISRAELRVFVHELRNHLNSLLMNAAVVSSACTDRERLGRYLDQIDVEGQRCADALHRLAERYLSDGERGTPP